MRIPILLEVALIFLLVELRMWVFASMGSLTLAATIVPIMLVIFSWYKRGDTLQSLGLHPQNFQKNWLALLVVVAVWWLIILLIALKWNPSFLNQKNLLPDFLVHLVLYWPWALLQQTWLNGYFVNRVSAGVRNPNATSLIVGILFGIAHLPNPVLVPVTFIGAIVSAHFFQKNRNNYLLAVCHALLAVSIKYFFPMEWHHNLRIGPGFYNLLD